MVKVEILNFNSPQDIWKQIYYWLLLKIVSGDFSKEEKFPAIREIALFLDTNRNTVNKSYKLLRQNGILTVRRGVGNFLTSDGVKKAKKIMVDKVKDSIRNSINEMKRMDLQKEDIERIFKVILEEQDECS